MRSSYICSECDSYINGFPLIYSIVRDNYEFFIGSGGRHLLHENVPTIQIRIIKPDLHYDFVDATLLMLFNKHLFLLTNSEDYRKYHSIPSGFFPDRCDRYYFEHHFNKSIFDDYSLVKVGYAGFYTEMRDIHNEKIYVGDVIRGLLHKSSPFQSVITDDGCDSGCDDHEMVFWFGSYDMPTPLSWITNFEIKGNVFDAYISDYYEAPFQRYDDRDTFDKYMKWFDSSYGDESKLWLENVKS